MGSSPTGCIRITMEFAKGKMPIINSAKITGLVWVDEKNKIKDKGVENPDKKVYFLVMCYVGAVQTKAYTFQIITDGDTWNRISDDEISPFQIGMLNKGDKDTIDDAIADYLNSE